MKEIRNKGLQTTYKHVTYLYDILEKAKLKGQKSDQWFQELCMRKGIGYTGAQECKSGKTIAKGQI